MFFRYFIAIFLFQLLLSTPAQTAFQRTKIAVLDFEVVGENKSENGSVGTMVAEWFITSIVKTGRFDVVERAMMKKIVEEQKLSVMGLIDEESATKAGKILGVKAIVTGSVLDLKDRFEINSRLINVENGSIIAAESIRGNNGGDTRSIVEQLTEKIINNFPLTGYIVKKTDKNVIIDLGSESGLVAGTEFIVFKDGEVIKHPKTGEILNIVPIITGRISIVQTDLNTAEGEILIEESGGIEYGHQIRSKALPNKNPDSQPKNVSSKILKNTSHISSKDDSTDQHLSTAQEKQMKQVNKSSVEERNATEVGSKSNQNVSNSSTKPTTKKTRTKMDAFDSAQLYKALDNVSVGIPIRWINPLTGTIFNISLGSPTEGSNINHCRNVIISSSKPNGQSDSSKTLLCKNKKGTWDFQ